MEDTHDLLGDSAVLVHVTGDEDSVWAELLGLDCGHCAVYTIDAGLVGACGDDASGRHLTDYQRLSAIFWVVALLYRGEEGVEIDMEEDLAFRHR